MTKKMKKSTVNLMWAIFWGVGALAWLPNSSAAIVDLPGMIFSPLCAAACVWQLVQCSQNRKTDYFRVQEEEKQGGSYE